MFITTQKVRVSITMVPEVRIELTVDPYQGSVLPLNYTGVQVNFNIQIIKLARNFYISYHIIY